MIDDYSLYKVNDFITDVSREIYDATKPKRKDRFTYTIASKDKFGHYDWYRFNDVSFKKRKDAEKFLEKVTKIHEKDENGDMHYFHEYSVYRGFPNSEMEIEREEYIIIEHEDGHYPVYDRKTINEMKRCLKKIKEAYVYAENLYKLINEDCSEEAFIERNKKNVEELKKVELIDKEYFENEEKEIDD